MENLIESLQGINVNLDSSDIIEVITASDN